MMIKKSVKLRKSSLDPLSFSSPYLGFLLFFLVIFIMETNCPDCGSKNVQLGEGCSLCLDCGYSDCSIGSMNFKTRKK